VELDRLAYRELLGRRHHAHERRAWVGNEPLDASEQVGHGSQAGERAQRVRGGQEGEGVTRGRRVDDDEVAHRTATPPWLDPAEQPVQDQELAQPRRRRGQHLERRALEQPSREHAEAKHALDEVAEQGLGLEAGGREPGPDADRLGAEARHAEQRAERPAADLDREHVPSARRGGVRQRRRDGRLPHTALARDDDQSLRDEREPGRHAGRHIRALRAVSICARRSRPRN